MNIRKFIAGLTLSVIMATSIFAADQTVIVLGNTGGENQPGAWMFNRDTSTSTPFNFTNTQARIGYGSLFVQPIGSSNRFDKFIGENFVRTNIAAVNSISFDFLMGNSSLNPNQFYMNVYTVFGDSSQTKFYDCRYDYVAAVGSDTTWTTVTFTPATVPNNVRTASGTSNPPSVHPCPATASGMDFSAAGSSVRAIAISLGDTSFSDAGYSGYFDKVVVDAVGGKTTYDFEPYLVASNKDQCKNGGWPNYRRADGSAFKNQGDCVSYTNNGK